MIRDAIMMATLEHSGCITASTPVLPELIVRCLEIKRDIVAADELDKGERMLLNFGHTIGHALERIGAARGIPITHGQGVARGMAVITAASERRGETESGTTRRLLHLLNTAGLPTNTDGFDPQEILDGIFIDKKNIADTLNIILVSRPGGGFIKTIHRDDMSGYLSEGGQ
jgi:3-dehydroquinate synthase